MTDSIAASILSYGLSGRVFHAPFLYCSPDYKLRMIKEGRNKVDTARFPGSDVRVVDSIDQIFDDTETDLIVVNTPDETHFDYSMRAIAAGKHVICEKPFTLSSAAARTLSDAAAAAKVHLSVFQNRRYDSDFRTVGRIISAGTIGRVVSYEAHFDRYRPTPKAGSWREQPATDGTGGGILWDLGPHLIDQAVALFGPPTRISADVLRVREASQVPDSFTVTLYYPAAAGEPSNVVAVAAAGTDMMPVPKASVANGLRVVLKASVCVAAATLRGRDAPPRYTVHGTLGSILKYGGDVQEPQLIDGAMPSDAAYGVEPSDSATVVTVATDGVPGPATVVDTEKGQYLDYFTDVAAAIRGQRRLPVTAEDGFRVIRLIELANISDKEGRIVDVDF